LLVVVGALTYQSGKSAKVHKQGEWMLDKGKGPC
ncbi:MAG: hypothetical protein JWQ89_1648, partial [Devosia sp.]|nr:hypothetical protein [Devosia sp.]